MSLTRIPYDPSTVARTGTQVNKFVVGVREDTERPEYVYVRLTAKGNQALFELCHTKDQKEVWQFPAYEFAIKKNSITVAQVKTARPSYVNAILIASRGVKEEETECSKNTRTVFWEDIRVPGYWGGSCAGCKWRDGAAGCSYACSNEAKLVPASVASLPRTAVEELED